MKKKLISLLCVIAVSLSALPFTTSAFNQPEAVFSAEELSDIFEYAYSLLSANYEALSQSWSMEEGYLISSAFSEADLLLTVPASEPTEEDYTAAYKAMYSVITLMSIIVSDADHASEEYIEFLTQVSGEFLTDFYFSDILADEGVKPLTAAALELIAANDDTSAEEYLEAADFLATALYESVYLSLSYYVSLISKLSFNDVSEDDWFYSAVKFVTDYGYFRGTGADTFSPNETMTRAMFVTVMSRYGEESADYNQTYSDISGDEYYADAVQWVYDSQWIPWAQEEAFLPDRSITRQEMITSMYHLLNSVAELDIDLSHADSLTDLGDAAEWAEVPMQWAYSAGLINGYGDGTVRPLSTATRAEVAQLFLNFTAILYYMG